ncbi:MAG: hypothetical protein DI538_10595 [Azospira oryzae]|nr:MAG: hypothetical protein DI538_10595 [Azospira oryzae]
MRFSSFKNMKLAHQYLILSIGVVITLLAGALVYMTYYSLVSKNSQLQLVAQGNAQSVIEKIDRNFYERFGDVQAFAANQLAVDAVTSDSSSEKLERFINTMVNYYVLYDLMIVCDRHGKVVAVNSKDKNGKAVQTQFLAGVNCATKDWFKACTGSKAPDGAWYSDFMEDESVSKVYSRRGWGMAFAAPIKKDNQIVGVWYNFANWKDVTVGIRKETEATLKRMEQDAFIILTTSAGQVIDSQDSTLVMKSAIPVQQLSSGMDFMMHDKMVSAGNYLIGSHQGTGAYSYAGKKWIALAFIPKTMFSFHYFIGNNLGFLIAIFVVLILSCLLFYRFATSMAVQLNILKTGIHQLSQGQFPQREAARTTNEIGEMTHAVKVLIGGLSSTAHFAEKVGAGDFDCEIKTLGKNDILGNALVRMRNNLITTASEERRRHWSNQGIAKMAVILRDQTADSKNQYHAILAFVVKHMQSNQGTLFLLNSEGERVLEMVACYAWEKRKFHEQQIAIGDGLVGQCFLEGETMYLRDIPADYVRITSGLGHALPNALLIVPVKINGHVYGVLELASFTDFDRHQIEFIEKLTENIAATISNMRVQFNTKKLLEQSQQQREELRAKEEEMRQSMEELNATQEEMKRYTCEMESRIAAINESGIASVEFGLNGTILNANPAFLKLMGYTMDEIRGKHHRIFVERHYVNSSAYEEFWQDLKNGITKPGEFKRIRKDGAAVFIHGSYSIIRNQNGDPERILKLAMDSTVQKRQMERMAWPEKEMSTI